MSDDLIYQSAKSLAQAIRDGDVSAVEVVQAHLERIDDVNDRLNAVVKLCAERALDEAREADAALARRESKGALHGVPMTLKDSLDTEGVVTTGGTLGRRTFVPERDSTVAARLRGAGAILLGKTNTPEITFAGETDNLVYGRTNNPYGLDRTPGGSSGGAAAIVAAGGSPFDMGSDTGGSIRGPAHLCGITGIKPNSGRVPRTGHIIPYAAGAEDSYTQNGPMARYVEDLVLTLPIISGPDWEDPAIVPMPLGDPADVDLGSLRVAFYTSAPGRNTPTQETVDAVNVAAGVVSSIVASVEEDVPAPVVRVHELNDRIGDADGRATMLRILQRAGTAELSPFIRRIRDEAVPISTEDFTSALEELDQYRSEMLEFMRSYDAIICPTASVPALPHGESYTDEHRNSNYMAPYNLTGWPGAVVRCGASPEGMPIGVQVISRPWREDVALALATVLESELGGYVRPDL